jgi:hypothetical protein
MKRKKQNQPKKSNSHQPGIAAKNKKSTDKKMLFVLAAVLITAICFLPMFRNGFMNWDDDVYVIKNQLLRRPDWNGIFIH